MLKVPALSLTLAGLALALAPACQAVFGDYTVNSSGLEDHVCQVDEYRCTGELLEVCAANRTHFETFASCGSADQCNLNSDSCRPCQAGVERQCSGATLFACNASAQWESLEDCASVALCSAAAGACLPPVCPTSGQHSCTDDGVLQRCSDDQTRWEKITACASAADCDAPAADAQAAAGEPVTCLVTCTSGSGACAAPTCDTPGTLRCVPDTLSLDRCSETFQWARVTVCRNFGLCNAVEGRCDVPRCEPGERRCTGNTLEECKGDLTGWTAVRTCSAGQLCDPSAPVDAECVPGPCTSGETRCNSIFLEQCNGTTWERSKRCSRTCDPLAKDCPATL